MSASLAKNSAVASEILTRARSLREMLALETIDANKKLSNAVLDVMLCTERLDNLGCLLALANSCIGQIRSRMCANSIPIPPPADSPGTATPSDSVGDSGTAGEFRFSERPHVVAYYMLLDMPVDSA